MFSQAADFKAKREERTGGSKQHNCMFQVGFLYFKDLMYLALNIKTLNNIFCLCYEVQFPLIKEFNLEGDRALCPNRK